MYEVVPSTRFRKDYRLAVKRGYNMKLLETVIDQLASGKQLDAKHRDHVFMTEFENVTSRQIGCYSTI